MKKTQLTRRLFNRLTAAAFGGMMTGSVIGCSQQADDGPDTSDEGGTADEGGTSDEGGIADAGGEVHVCRGLNTCKGQGAQGTNECAGQGTCATASHHTCGGQNECKGQGGCGENPGSNDCKGEGHCAVPMKGDMWQKARDAFKARMEAEGNSIGDAPEPTA